MSKSRSASLKLTDCGLYALASPSHLASQLSTPKNKISAKDLVKLAKDEGNYRLFTQTQKNGKLRPIQEPKRELQNIHARIHTLLSRVQVPDYIYSAVRGRSYVSNAAAHDLSKPTTKIDIKKFFPSVHKVAIFKFFLDSLKCRRDVAGLLADLLTFEDHLATGSAASPIIAYYSFKPMFDEIYDFSLGAGLTMTCYVDDMTFSGEKAKKGTLYEVKKIITQHSLKSHKARVFSASQPKIVTGVCNTPKGARVPNKQQLNIKIGFDDLQNAKNPLEQLRVLQPLAGRLDSAAQIDEKFRAKVKSLRSQYAEVFFMGQTLKKSKIKSRLSAAYVAQLDRVGL